MIAPNFRCEGLGLVLIEPAQHQHAVAELGERLENWGQGKVRAFGCRRPLVHHDPIGDLDER